MGKISHQWDKERNEAQMAKIVKMIRTPSEKREQFGNPTKAAPLKPVAPITQASNAQNQNKSAENK